MVTLGQLKDPAIRALYDIISKYWSVKKKQVYAGGDEEVEEEGSGELDDSQEIDEQCQDDLYGHPDLAASLGVTVMAEEVQPCPESQVPADSFSPEVFGSPTEDPKLLEEFGQNFCNPEEDGQPASPEITPTELEDTPKEGEVIEIADSPIRTVVKGDRLPNRNEYTEEDLRHLQGRIAEIKPLPFASVIFPVL